MIDDRLGEIRKTGDDYELVFERSLGCRLRLTQTQVRPPHMVSVASGWHAYLECLPGAAADEVTPWRAEREREFFVRYQALSPA